MLIEGMNDLNDAVAFALAAQSNWPASMYMPDGQFVMTYDSGEKAPDNEVLGPVTPRGGPSGLVYRGGHKIAEWGDVDRADMTFSVAKSYLALLAGLALGDGLIKSLDDKVADYALDDGFTSEQNRDITWRHLLTQTSEWEGTVFGKEVRIDHNRVVGVAVADAPFMAVEMQVDGAGPAQQITFRTNVDDIVACGHHNPLRFVVEPGSGGGWKATTCAPATPDSSCWTIGWSWLEVMARLSHGFST